jgi:hypothetical protein
MTRIRVRRFASAAIAIGVVAFAPALAGRDAKSKMINWRMGATAAQVDAKGTIQYDPTPGRRQFKLTVANLDPGTYRLERNRIPVAALVVSDRGSRTKGKLVLRERKGQLTFDPSGAELTVSLGGATYLGTTFPSSTQTTQDKVEIEAELVSTGVLPGARGEAEFESEAGRSEFEVEVRGLPLGDFEVLVGGVQRGIITVNPLGKGELEFETEVTDVDDDGVPDVELLLDFDPRGQLVQVAQAGLVILETVFPTVATPEDDDDDDSGDESGDRDDDDEEDGDDD